MSHYHSQYLLYMETHEKVTKTFRIPLTDGSLSVSDIQDYFQHIIEIKNY